MSNKWKNLAAEARKLLDGYLDKTRYLVHDLEFPCIRDDKEGIRVRIASGGFDTTRIDEFVDFPVFGKRDLSALQCFLESAKNTGPVLLDRPSADPVMAGLKEFQQRTVEHVFSCLYTKRRRRFLVADEVGLGKTLVARGVVAKAVEHLWNKKGPDGRPLRIDIIYLCSNRAIASQNINKLTILGINSHVAPTRVTLLARQLEHFHDRLNFVALTPGTSLNLTFGTGLKDERAMLMYLLNRAWGKKRTDTNIMLFRDSAGHESFKSAYKEIRNAAVNPVIEKNFREELAKSFPSAKAVYEQLVRDIVPYQKSEKLPDELHSRRRQFLIAVRKILAKASIAALEPDLVILDEFQRFRTVLDSPDDLDENDDYRNAAELANILFSFGEARVLLLSATPYKMYTVREEGDEDHYRDFIRTTGFLLDDPQRLEEFERDLFQYRRLFRNAVSHGAGEELAAVKTRVLAVLRECMARTERFRFISSAEGLVRERILPASLESGDIKAYAVLASLPGLAYGRSLLEYWKSSPYLFNIMEGYQAKARFNTLLKKSDDALVRALESDLFEQLDLKAVEHFRPLIYRNGRLRSLIESVLPDGSASHRRLWMPPTVSYWNTGNLYPEGGGEDTKTLIFSSWRMVPKAIGLLVSYEAERRIFKSSQKSYFKTGEESPRLNFSMDGEKPGAMNIFLLIYPSLFLARSVDPLSIAAGLQSQTGNKATAAEMVAETARYLRETIGGGILADDHRTDNQRRDYWRALSVLDNRIPEYASDRKYWALSAPWVNRDVSGKEKDAGLRAHLSRFSDCEDLHLNRISDDMWERLAKTALGSPAVIMLRVFLKLFPDPERYLFRFMAAAFRVALGFRTLFNRPDAMAILRGSSDEQYPETVLDYAIEGNLQAVLDEYAHLLYDVNGLHNRGPIEAADRIAVVVNEAVSLRTANGVVDEIRRGMTGHKLKQHRMHYSYAMSFGQHTEVDEGGDRDEKVRCAFNSPFRPFVLASTSIGQEGLDFHLYCHSIWHWNLPSNPVDLEQREGRINRYKGHMIRKNIAASLSPTVHEMKNGWETLFKRAEKESAGSSRGLVPFWIYENENAPFAINRFIPTLLMGRDELRYHALREQLMLYRMAFGQPRQQDLIEYLQEQNLSDEEMARLMEDGLLDLSP